MKKSLFKWLGMAGVVRGLFGLRGDDDKRHEEKPGLVRRFSRYLFGGAIGAGLMYFLDPGRGARRRSLVMDKVGKYRSEAGDLAQGESKHMRNVAQGVMHETKARMSDEPVDDDTLVGRVRSELGRVASDVGSLEVSAHEGKVTLRGPVLEDEMEKVVSTTNSVRGVKEVDNQLESHKQTEEIPGLQK